MPNRIKRKQAVEYIIDGICTSNELCVDKCRYFWYEDTINCTLFREYLKLTKHGDAFRCEHCLSLVGNEQDYFSIKDEDKLIYKSKKVK